MSWGRKRLSARSGFWVSHEQFGCVSPHRLKSGRSHRSTPQLQTPHISTQRPRAPRAPHPRVTSSKISPHVYHLINMMCRSKHLYLLSRQTPGLMRSRYRGPAVCNSTEHFLVRPVNPAAVIGEESFALRPYDVGHLDVWPIHFFL
jgi:hypothetical protein